MLTVETRHAMDPVIAKGFDTAGLCSHFHAGGLLADGEIRLAYSHCDRMIAGGAAPAGGTLIPDQVEQSATPSVLDRREMGSADTSSERVTLQFLHPDVADCCQLLMGYSQFAPGLIGNTMPAHSHDQRMGACHYFELGPEQRDFHSSGQPDETHYIVLTSKEVVISPPWSIHCGVGTGASTFCWAMAGDNVDFTDVDMVAIGEFQ